jgi:hypothetical protein
MCPEQSVSYVSSSSQGVNRSHGLHLVPDTYEAGKKADVVVLYQNIFDDDPRSIRRTNVPQTIVNGDVDYSTN